ncbi:MAG TPA: ATP-binding protein [Streptosporangiaceae bacterium]|nr:ATP-binding protein [Streptosporangiaceae bacterium]
MTHDRLLTASGYREADAEDLPSGFADVLQAADLPAAPDDLMTGERDEPAVTCELAAGAESARRAREFTRVTLQDWGMAGQSYVAELVVSELVTNSLRHGLLSARWMPGEHPIGLTILRRDPYVMCMVSDPGRARPVRIDSCAGAEGGRGLQVVESCSVRWGWQPVAGDGKVVWALLQLTQLRGTAGRLGPGPLVLCRLPPRCSAALSRAGRRTRRP